MSRIVIHETSMSDSQVLDFIDKLLAELSNGQDSEIVDRAVIRRELNLAKNHTAAFLAAADDASMGLATVVESFALYAGGCYGVINELYVLPAYRSRAVGVMLINHIKQFGQQRGWHRIEVTAPPEPAWARTVVFYEREGFRLAGPKLKFVY